MRQIEAIKQIIKKEDRNNDKLPDTNLEKTLITWAVDEGIILMDNLVLDTDRVALLEKVCLFCVDRVE